MFKNAVVTTFENCSATYYFIHEIILNNLKYEKKTNGDFVTITVIGTNDIKLVTDMYDNALKAALTAFINKA